MPHDEEYQKATFKMKTDITPLQVEKFIFDEKYCSKTAPKEGEACPFCVCAKCECEPNTEEQKDINRRGSYENMDFIFNSDYTLMDLEEVFLKYIKDQDEWNKIVKTYTQIENRSKAENFAYTNFAESDLKPTDEVNRFTDYQRFAAVGILSEFIDKLVIIGANQPKLVPILNFHPPKVRYNEKVRRRMFDVDTNALISEQNDPRALVRFQRLRTLLEQVVRMARSEVFEKSTCDSTKAYLLLEEKRLKEDEIMYNTHTEALHFIKTLKQIQSKNEEDTNKVLAMYEATKRKLQKELQHEMFTYGVYLSYYKDWAEAEFESEKWDKDENYFKWIDNGLKKCEQNINVEDRVHRDVTMFLKLSISKLKKDVKMWSDKYEADMEAKDSELSRLKQRRKDLHQKVKEMVSSFEERQAAIQKYLKERAERERKIEEKRMMDQAAVKIQAWWRGTMVRWEFGKYDQDKGKKKKGKGKAVKGKK